MTTKSGNSPLTIGVSALIMGIMLPILGQFVTAQEMATMLELPQIVPGGGVQFGVNKLFSTFTFTGNADVSRPIWLTDSMGAAGSLRFTNVYHGLLVRTQTTSVRDDESGQLGLDLPVVNMETEGTLSGLLRTSYILSQDSRNVGLSSLQRGSFGIGAKYSPTPTLPYVMQPWWLEAIAGYESTTQLGVQALGPFVAGRAYVNQLDLEDWFVNGYALADWHRIDAQRENHDYDASANISRFTPDGSRLNVGVNALSLGRQYYTTIAGQTAPLSIEQRAENKISVNFDLLSKITKTFFIGGIGNVQANAVERSYAEGSAGLPITSVSRRLGEFLIDVEGSVGLEFETSRFVAGGSVFLRDEQNTVSAVHSISEEDLTNIRSQESQRDNEAARTRIFSKGLWRPSVNDTLSAEWNWWLLRYDTPSEMNADDRDELTAEAVFRYSRRISDVLSAGFATSFRFEHLVFLNSANSGQNYQRRVLLFSPFVNINGSVIRMQPRFDILANYTVYDFEGAGASVASYGFRQMMYRDSIFARISGKLHFESPILLRYFENSTLLWSDFAEVPQVGNLEYLLKFLIFSRSGTSWDVGAGIRLYRVKKQQLLTSPGGPDISADVKSWAPEAVIRFFPSSGSSLEVMGWYEFRTLWSSLPAMYTKQEIPNVMLLARVPL